MAQPPPVESHDAGSAAVPGAAVPAAAAPAAAAVAEPYPPLQQQPNFTAPQSITAQGLLAQMSTNGWILCGAAAAVFLGSLLPWVTVSAALGISISAKPHSGGVFLFLLLAAAAIAFGWPVIRGTLSKRRWLGLTVTAAALSLFAVTNWSDLSDLQNKYRGQPLQISAGFGLYLYTAGVVALWVCVTRIFLTRRRQTPKR